MGEKQVYSYDALIRETPKAYLLLFADEEVWLPKSQVDLDHVAREVEVPDWLAKEKGLDLYGVD